MLHRRSNVNGLIDASLVSNTVTSLGSGFASSIFASRILCELAVTGRLIGTRVGSVLGFSPVKLCDNLHWIAVLHVRTLRLTVCTSQFRIE